MTTAEDRRTDATPAAHPLLPDTLLLLSLDDLPLAGPLLAELRAAGLATAGDLLALPSAAFGPGGWPGDDAAAALRTALAARLAEGVRASAEPDLAGADWPAIQHHLLGRLRDDDRTLLRALLGLGEEPRTLPEQARAAGEPLATLTARADELRALLRRRAEPLLAALRAELGAELAAFDGVVTADRLAHGSLLQGIARGAGDPLLPLRLLAFACPESVHLHGEALAGLPPRRFRRLLRALRSAVTEHRLPLPLDRLLAELAQDGHQAGRGLVVHLLRSELRLSLELDAAHGETVVPDPRSPTARLAELLAEIGVPLPFEDLVFAYRERYRRASRTRLAQRLRGSPTFLMLGPDLWSLRARHHDELAAARPLADKAARLLCATGGKQNVAKLLAPDHPDDRTIWLVLDHLARDGRVRLLGRGEACPATHRRSQVLEQLLVAFRRAAGDVVVSLFVDNQPPERQRLVQRLLRENRLFVTPSADRIDTLTNYPFNDERLGRLLALVGRQLDQRAGYAQLAALKATVDRTDLGGTWLTPMLLGDLLRRHGPFDLLPGGIVARQSLGLPAAVRRTARQALRDAGGALSVDDLLRARPDLADFGAGLEELLESDPLVQTRDGVRFALA